MPTTRTDVHAPKNLVTAYDPEKGDQKQLKSDSPIAIVGGSLTGPALALLLGQAGFSNVNVYEAAPESAPQGGGVIGLDHVSLGIFESLGIEQPEFLPFASERVVTVKVASRRERGRVLTFYAGANTTWTLLHRALASRLPDGKLQKGRRVKTLGADEAGRALLGFADGSDEAAEMVVFADGRRSTGRRLLQPERKLSYAGYVAHRGQVLLDPGAREFTRFEPSNTQFNTFPIPIGDRIGVDWTFYLPATPEQFQAYFGGEPTRRTFVLPHQVTDAARAAVDEAARRLLPAAEAELVLGTEARMAAAVVDIEAPDSALSSVGSSPAVLMGDALAPVRPHTARGANNGLDQAANFASVLGLHRKYGATLGTALEGWEQRHLPQVADALRLGPEIARRLGLQA